MHRVYLLVLLVAAAVGCEKGNPSSPSDVVMPLEASQPSAPSPTILGDAPEGDSSDNRGSGPPPRFVVDGPRSGCLELRHWTWVITTTDAADRLRNASFHDDRAGCERTIGRPGGTLSETEVSRPGRNVWTWTPGVSCGRYQADIAIGETPDFLTIVGVVINTGVDCEAPDPPSGGRPDRPERPRPDRPDRPDRPNDPRDDDDPGNDDDSSDDESSDDESDDDSSDDDSDDDGRCGGRPPEGGNNGRNDDDEDGNCGHGNDPDHDDRENPGQGGGNHHGGGH